MAQLSDLAEHGASSPAFAIPEPIEHTDLVDVIPVFDAYAAMLPVARGDKVAAAILAVGAVLADALQRQRGGGRDG